MNNNEIIAKINTAVRELDNVIVEGHSARKRMVVAVELLLYVMNELAKRPEEVAKDGNITEAE